MNSVSTVTKVSCAKALHSAASAFVSVMRSMKVNSPESRDKVNLKKGNLF